MQTKNYFQRKFYHQPKADAISFCKHVRMKMITPRRQDRKRYPQWEVTVFTHQTASTGHSGANYLLAEWAIVLPCCLGFKTWPSNSFGACPLRGVCARSPGPWALPLPTQQGTARVAPRQFRAQDLSKWQFPLPTSWDTHSWRKHKRGTESQHNSPVI